MKRLRLSALGFGLAGLYFFSLVMLLSSCDNTAGVGPPLTSTCDYSNSISLSVVEYENEADLKAYYEKIIPWMKKEKYNILGFATMNKVTGAHTLHVMKVRGQNDHERIETLGHELMHSFCNDWHPPVIRG